LSASRRADWRNARRDQALILDNQVGREASPESQSRRCGLEPQLGPPAPVASSKDQRQAGRRPTSHDLRQSQRLSAAGAHHKTVAQVILRWLTQREVVVIPKSVRNERFEEDFTIFDFNPSSDDMVSITTLGCPCTENRIAIGSVAIDHIRPNNTSDREKNTLIARTAATSSVVWASIYEYYVQICGTVKCQIP